LSIFFHKEGIKFEIRRKNKIKNWIRNVIKLEKKEIGNLNIVFTSDKNLQKLNKKYLTSNNLTDVITFDYKEDKKISGDIYISVERVRQNADTFDETFEREIKRVIIHGILHLIGYKDKEEKEKENMKVREECYLSLF
jgi:probable rRNA maturation factor